MAGNRSPAVSAKVGIILLFHASRTKIDAIIYDSFDNRKESGYNSLQKGRSKTIFFGQGKAEAADSTY